MFWCVRCPGAWYSPRCVVALRRQYEIRRRKCELHRSGMRSGHVESRNRNRNRNSHQHVGFPRSEERFKRRFKRLATDASRMTHLDTTLARGNSRFNSHDAQDEDPMKSDN